MENQQSNPLYLIKMIKDKMTPPNYSIYTVNS